MNYKIKVIEKDGEPYGRPVNPYNSNPVYDIDDPKDRDRAAQQRVKHSHFERFADTQTCPFPGAQIGKIYSGDEVEGPVWQYLNKSDKKWQHMTPVSHSIATHIKFYQQNGFETRQIYRLKSSLQKPDDYCKQTTLSDESCKQSTETAEEAAERLYPLDPEDVFPNVMLNEAEKQAFLAGVEWQKGKED